MYMCFTEHILNNVKTVCIYVFIYKYICMNDCLMEYELRVAYIYIYTYIYIHKCMIACICVLMNTYLIT
jgi:hypothetical protein